MHLDLHVSHPSSRSSWKARKLLHAKDSCLSGHRRSYFYNYKIYLNVCPSSVHLSLFIFLFFPSSSCLSYVIHLKREWQLNCRKRTEEESTAKWWGNDVRGGRKGLHGCLEHIVYEHHHHLHHPSKALAWPRPSTEKKISMRKSRQQLHTWNYKWKEHQNDHHCHTREAYTHFSGDVTSRRCHHSLWYVSREKL